MDETESKLKTLKNRVTTHVTNHRAKYAFVAGFVSCGTLLYKMDRVSEWNKFLEEKGLTEEFYAPEM